MPREFPSVRILPMSDRIEGFRGRSIEDVQRNVFLRGLPKMNGRYRYRSTGLNAPGGTIVLFQFRGHVIASAVFMRDEKFDKPRGPHAGQMYFEPGSLRVFHPVDADAMRKAWPWFRRFGHVKQALNPAGYASFKRRLKNVRAPASSS
jgi:hypothetical protein